MMLKSSLFLASLPAVAFAACHDVDVGDGGLVFNPTSLTAAVGDTVNFHFYPGDHGVASGSFSSACQPSGNMWSGYINPSSGEADMMYTITVSSTDPMFFYCPQVGHCQDGMVMAINPSSSESLAAYMKAAKGSSTSKAPSAVGGGMVVANKDCAAAVASSSGAASSSVAVVVGKSTLVASSSAAATPVAGSSSAAAMSSAGMTTPVAMSSAAMTSAAVTTPSASPYPTPIESSGAVSQISDGQPQVSSPVAPAYTGAANSMNGAAAAVVAAAGMVGMAMI